MPAPKQTPLERARAIAPILEANAQTAEEERTLPPESVKALVEAGLFRVGLPRELGGDEIDFAGAIDVWEEVARADGSAGWTLMANASAAAAASAFLSDEAVAKIFGESPERTVGGQFAPRGTGQAEDAGFRVTGSYSFGSGTAHSAWISAGFIPFEDGQPRMAESGLPDMRVGFVPREHVRFTDGWHVMGLRGTGSYDYEVEGQLIPDGFHFPLFGKVPRRGGDTFKAIFRLGMMPMTGAGHAAFALGVGRRALDEIRGMARERQRMGDPTPIGGRLTFQKEYARAEAKLRAARLLVLDTFGDAYETSRAGGAAPPEQRALLRTAAAWATEVAKDVCDFAHEKAGTVAIRDGSALQRCFRDIHTGSQHAFIGEKIYTDSADILLGNVDDAIAL
jgi:alkylation response protein AidB-like acyl-CoA dehydrogenase